MRTKRAVLALVLILAAGAALAAAAPLPGQAPAIRLKVVAEQANLREKPDIGSSIVQQIPEGTVVEADRKDGEWYFVRYALEDGGVLGGWIHESLVEVVRPAAGAAAAPPKTTPPEAAPTGRARRPIRIGRIKAPEFRSGDVPLEISVSAGAATLAPRDLNDGTQGFVDWRGGVIGVPNGRSAGLVHLAALAGFELSYRLSPQLALGLGADLLGGSHAGRIELADPPVSEEISTKPSVRAVSIKAAGRYYPGAGLYVRGALGLYSVRAGYAYRIESTGGWEQWKGSASTSGLGAEAAIGGEWGVGPRTLVFAEAGFRMASLRGLTGRNEYRSSVVDPVLEPGTLFFFHKLAADDAAYPLIFVRAAVPGEEGVVDARRARINISGTAVRLGVRYRF